MLRQTSTVHTHTLLVEKKLHLIFYLHKLRPVLKPSYYLTLTLYGRRLQAGINGAVV